MSTLSRQNHTGPTKTVSIVVLTFSDVQFPFNFQVIDRFSTNILIGMNFIIKYHCVPYAIDGLFLSWKSSGCGANGC